MSPSSQIICLIVLVLLGGFFSFAEISLAAASKLRLSAMVEDGVRGAQAALRIKGRGMPKLRGKGNGDMNILVRVKVPKTLTAKERELLMQLAKETGQQVKS